GYSAIGATSCSSCSLVNAPSAGGAAAGVAGAALPDAGGAAACLGGGFCAHSTEPQSSSEPKLAIVFLSVHLSFIEAASSETNERRELSPNGRGRATRSRPRIADLVTGRRPGVV